MDKKWQKKLLFYSLGLVIGYEGARLLGRKVVRDVSADMIKIIMTDLYDENLWEFVSATSRFTPQVIVETNCPG